jgi:hypothetical protein
MDFAERERDCTIEPVFESALGLIARSLAAKSCRSGTEAGRAGF